MTFPPTLAPDIASAEQEFEARCTAYDHDCVAELRQKEYGRLDQTGQIYLDYTGGGLYAQSQLQTHQRLLNDHVFGNPHSQNPTSLAMTKLVEETRAHILRYFRADPAEYTVIFTPNASGALKLVGESYPFTADSHYLLTFDNHNSVLGMREFARHKGAKISYIPVVAPDLRADEARFRELIADRDPQAHNLFSYPAQSNFSGVQHPLGWIAEAQAQGWDVLLDAAAFAPSNQLDLTRYQPDFVCLSFYKIFGYPTGLGALIARKQTLGKLQRPWFAGGTITISSVQGDGHYLAEGEAAFEDGTVDYLNIPAIKTGLQHIEAMGLETIHDRVMELTSWLLENLLALRHSNGRALLKLYGPCTTEARGGTVTFNLYDPEGNLHDFHRLEQLASEAHISLRTGCFCNPGAGEVAHGLTAEDMRQFFQGHQCLTYDEFIHVIQGHEHKSAGSIRISVGIATNFADVYRFVQFLRGFLDMNAK